MERPAERPGVSFLTMRTEKPVRARVAPFIVAAATLSLVFLAYEYTRYFPASELDRKPYPMRRVDLDPPQARNGVEYYGKLRLDLFIDARGAVDRVEVVGAEVPERLRDNAVKAFSQTRWEPGRKWGIRVKSVKRVEIDFEPPPGVRDRGLRPPDS